MVELPQHVHRITKRRKTGDPIIYTFYTRHRNTAQAWPSIRLPEPLSAEFSTAVEICTALDFNGGEFVLHGLVLPSPKDKEFWPKATKAYKAVVRRQHSDAKDFTALVETFNDDANPIWSGKLSKSTKRGYVRYAAMIKEAWAFDLPADLTTVDAQEAIDVLGDTPATANQFRAYLSRLMSWGIPRGFASANPVAFTEKIPGGEPWTPWPDWAFDILFEHAPFNCLMPAISALFTAQRQGDVLEMIRPKKADTTIPVRAQKTKSTVWIPIHSAYRPWIEKAPANSTHLHVGVKGQPYQSADGFRSEWQRMMNTEAFKPFRENRIVFHGLRKNAVINLLEVGCTEAEAGSIANMSAEMVRHYGRDVSMRRLAENAMKRMESNWSAVALPVLEQEQNENWKPSVRIGNQWQRSHKE